MLFLKKIRFIFDKKQKKQMVLLLFSMIVSSVLELIGISALIPLIEVLSEPNSVSDSSMYRSVSYFVGELSIKDYIVLIAASLILVFIIKNIFMLAQSYFQASFSVKNQMIIQRRLMETYMRQDYLFHVEHNIAEIQRNVVTDVNNFQSIVITSLQLLTDIILCCVMLLYIFVTDALITILTIICLGLFGVIYYKIFKNRLKVWGEKNREVNAIGTKWFLQSFNGIKEIKVSNKEDYFLDNWKRWQEKCIGYFLKLTYISAVPKPVIEVLCIGFMLIVIIVSVLTNDWNSISDVWKKLTVFALAAYKMMPSANRILGSMATIKYNSAAIDAIYNSLKEAEIMDKTEASENCDNKKIEFNSEIRFSNVVFSYPGSENKILDNVNLTIKKGQSIALIGPTGSGKTTTADLLLGVLSPVLGNIFIDDNNLKNNEKSWHEIVSYIPQNIYLIDDSIRNNVAFGIEPDKIDDNQVANALKGAQLYDYVYNLTEGVETVIGDRGVKLSGGQRQRLGIARALYTNPSLLVLDEATSALDTETESAVMEAINGLKGHVTMVIIAHRLSTIRNCDNVYEVKDGKVHETR